MEDAAFGVDILWVKVRGLWKTVVWRWKTGSPGVDVLWPIGGNRALLCAEVGLSLWKNRRRAVDALWTRTVDDAV